MGTGSSSEVTFEFEGIGFAVNGDIDGYSKGADNNYTLEAELYVDGELITTSKLPNNYTTRKNTLLKRSIDHDSC